MRKRRWLAIAVLVMVAPAASVFVSDLYFLGFSEDHPRKIRLFEESYEAAYRAEIGSVFWQEPGPSMLKRSYLGPREPTLWEVTKGCEGDQFSVAVVEPENLSERLQSDAKPVIERAQRHSRFIFQIHPELLSIQARAYAGWELAAIHACLRGTPFQGLCRGYLSERAPSDEDVAEVLVERGDMAKTENGYCYNWPTYEFVE